MSMFWVLTLYTAACFCGLIGLDFVTVDYTITNKTTDTILVDASVATTVASVNAVTNYQQKILEPLHYFFITVGLSTNMGLKTSIAKISARVAGRTDQKDYAELSNPESHFLGIRRDSSGQLVIQNFVQ